MKNVEENGTNFDAAVLWQVWTKQQVNQEEPDDYYDIALQKAKQAVIEHTTAMCKYPRGQKDHQSTL
ncbi:hypothetical protein [Helicobacter heilmannii]|uniref:Uncharacterized protein n=1 Tax=Helicobacter heilmannii TaxID=35817 RepID=A0A0K2XFS7_HELHE|nr:hypothetical protein [Helicobacter heilmannii]CCM73448.1 hypothetical protein BN341_7180 [Helicobacter heilmannii ASB1.4]CCM73451.1 hypothetical protein BN341_7210 [Helicobacter heilmannii ASB1.4]CRF46191.1 hypothetical protein HHE014_11850 [Helicobacter heilmannii]CRF49823.1 hypothetical protein HHE03_14950 [Helicobacter heilmannii]CRI34425.1 hypothetical protein HHE01_12710 [Helicobacter heilmannii]